MCGLSWKESVNVGEIPTLYIHDMSYIFSIE